MKRLQLNIFLLIITSLALYGQNVSITGKAPKVVALGEQFTLSYTISSQISNFYPPSFNGFSILSGPSSSQSSQMQIINGKVSQSFILTYSYTLSANKIGKHTIPVAKIRVKKNIYQSNVIPIEVAQGKNTSKQTNTQKTNNSDITISNDDVFIRLLTNKKEVYQGESLVASLKIYRKIKGVDLKDIKLSSLQGFYKEDLKPNNYWQRENINGTVYETAEINRFLLYPQKSGKIIFNPTEIEIEITVQTGWTNRGFFRQPTYKKTKKKIYSPEFSINVIPIPSNSPKSYTGAVGDYKMTASIDNNNVKTNDAITLKVVISGSGNIKLAGAPIIHFPPDVEYYNDPKISTNLNSTDAGTYGTKIYEHLLLPRNAGDFHIPPIKFSYFNLKTKSFKTIKSDEFIIHVEKGDENDENITIVQGLSKKEVTELGTDIKYIETGDINLKLKNDIFFGTFTYYLLYLIFALIFIAITIFTHNNRKRNKDTLLIKHVKAKKIARKRLRFAHKALASENYDLFYEEALKAMWGYLGDKLKIPVSKLSRDMAIKHLTKNNIPNEAIENLMQLIDKCEYARFAPSSDAQKNDVLYEDIVEKLGELEN